MISKILVATDGSAHAEKAVTFAADLTEKYGAELDLIHIIHDLGTAVVPPGTNAYEEIEHIRTSQRNLLESAAHEILQAAQDVARDHGVSNVRTALRSGDPAGEVVKHAEENRVDLIVMGTRGLSGPEALLFGSVSRKIHHLAPCSCLTVH